MSTLLSSPASRRRKSTQASAIDCPSRIEGCWGPIQLQEQNYMRHSLQTFSHNTCQFFPAMTLVFLQGAFALLPAKIVNSFDLDQLDRGVGWVLTLNPRILVIIEAIWLLSSSRSAYASIMEITSL
mmetsp:Transcript_46217/g.119108  ORF Transcript_46217/g.119108 Transcript_46217/m.119108 type:complete len:126 (-) Transcript_46217:1006-1383(-)